MKVTNKITIHLDDPQVQRPVNVMQCDVHTRVLEIALFAGGKKWEIPDRITPVISYHKPDGTGGLYDTLPDGSSACRMDKNTVWAILPPPALEVPGRIDLVVIFTDDDGNQLATFGVPVDVHRNPGVGAVASGNYFNLQKWVKETAVAAVPKVLPNPQKLILTGAVKAEYDGSGEVKVEIPEGSGVHIGPDRPQNGEAIWIKTDEQDEEPEGGGTVSPEAIKQAVGEYMAANPLKETDPTVPDWAKQPNKPKYTAAEVGALPADTTIPEGVTDEQIKNAVDAYLSENPPEVSGGGRMSFKTKISIAESTAGFALDQIDGQPFCFRRMVVVIESICASTTSDSSNTWLNPIVNNKSFQGLRYAVGQNASKVTAFEFEAFADDVDFAKVFCAATSANRDGLFDVWQKTAPMTVQGAGITSIRFTMGDKYTTFENGTVFYIFAEEL